MSYDRTEELPELPQRDGVRDADGAASETRDRAPPRVPRTAAETVADQKPAPAQAPAAAQKTAPEQQSAPEKKAASERPAKQVSKEKVKSRERLPALEDDADVGAEKSLVVTRDGKADLAFTGVLVASAAPEHTIEDHWWEYRVYLTNGGKHVFSKVDRTIYEGEDDAWTAEVFDPSPSSVPSQLLRSARELARSKPVTWQEAAVSFYGYGPIAKALYRKLDGPFEEQIE